MSAAFEIDLSPLLGDSRFAPFANALGPRRRIDSPSAFNHFCRSACEAWSRQFPKGVGQTSDQFEDLSQVIQTRAANTIPTGWGGVFVTLHEHPRVEKFLVVRRGGYLALEMHDQK